MTSGEPVTIASTASVDEYNAFGPWVATVRDAADVPPIFATFLIDFAATRLVLKFPRPESRRDLVAGMDLYDHLVVLSDTRIEVLTRGTESFTANSFPLDQLAAISAAEHLLDGRLTLQFTNGDTHSIAYNGSSVTVVSGLVEAIRGLILHNSNAGRRRFTANRALDLPWGMDDLGKPDVGLVTTAIDALTGGTFGILSRQARVRLTPTGGRFGHIIRPATLQGSVVAASDTELLVISRVEWITRTRTPELSSRRTVVFLSHVDSIRSQRLEEYDGVEQVVVTSGKSRTAILLPSGSDGVAALTAYRG